MITRTIDFTDVSYFGARKDSHETVQGFGFVEGDITKLSQAQQVKAVQKAFNDDYEGQLVVIEVTSAEKKSALYGITERDFMAHAVQLDPVTRKPLESSYDFS